MSYSSPRDDNFVPAALFEVDGLPGTVMAGQIDQLSGRILVDITGALAGSSMALEIPTGTVDGSNTIFSSVNVPLFVEVSGQVMVSKTQDATNYGFKISGSAGAYTLTFTNPPAQTPHSFYNTGSTSNLSQFFQTDTFTSTAGQTVFTATLTPTFVLSVIVNDQPQTLATDYTQAGGTFTLNTGIPAGLKVTLTYVHS